MFFVFHYFFILDIYVTGRKRDCRRPRKRPLGVIHFASSPNIPDCFIGYKLPFSHNQEKSSNRCSLEYRARKSKYYLRSCFHPYRSLTNYVWVALPKQEWTQAIIIEMKALQKTKHGVLFPYPTQMKENYQANGITERYKPRHVETNMLKHSEVGNKI